MNTPNNSTMAMIPWLHFRTRDYLIFKAWQPSSHGAVAGACMGLFIFCILERCLAAYQRSEELRWRAIGIRMSGSVQPSASQAGNTKMFGEGSTLVRKALVPSFSPSRDIPRGVIQAIQSAFSYALMLSVMTFNAAYIMSVILGLSIGEVLFGRMGHK